MESVKGGDMAGVYRIFGAELSPYSVKVRSYFRYKGIPHEWVVRTVQNQAEFDRHAKLPLIPLVIAPDGTAMQDSTPIIERLEAECPGPSIHPPDPTAAFVSALLEEYGDEWGNKPMFHYRWFYEADQESGAERIARSMNPEATGELLDGIRAAVKGRMIPRLTFVGSSAATKDQIEGSFLRQIAILDRHLESRPFLFGGRPAFGDLGLYAQLYECSTDPTPGAIIRARAPRVQAWIERMLAPQATASWEPWPALEPTLLPLLREEVAGVFFPWSAANARALAAGEKEFTVELGGKPFTQETQKYHAKSLAALRARYAAVADKHTLDTVLERAGCRTWLGAA
jgi:glutathione S-transferase